MGWSDMNCLQKTARIMMVIAVLSILACLIFNCVAIYKSVDDTWFTNCEDCGPGKEKCVKCCKDCTAKDEWFFYIFRGYTLLFCLVGLGAEFKTELFDEYMKICHYFIPRGFWQIFIGLSTVVGNVLRDDDDAEQWADVIGYILVGVGCVHMLLGCACFKEYSKEKRDSNEYDLSGRNSAFKTNAAAGPSQI